MIVLCFGNTAGMEIYPTRMNTLLNVIFHCFPDIHAFFHLVTWKCLQCSLFLCLWHQLSLCSCHSAPSATKVQQAWGRLLAASSWSCFVLLVHSWLKHKKYTGNGQRWMLCWHAAFFTALRWRFDPDLWCAGHLGPEVGLKAQLRLQSWPPEAVGAPAVAANMGLGSSAEHLWYVRDCI